MEFQRVGKLYIYDTSEAVKSLELSCLQSVKNNKLMFSRREVDQADKALALHRVLGYLGFEKISSILDNNLVHNCPLRSSDFKRAIQMYGIPQAMLQGKSTRQNPKNSVPIPAGKLYMNVVESQKKSFSLQTHSLSTVYLFS